MKQREIDIVNMKECLNKWKIEWEYLCIYFVF